jgi:hypothetical protein
VLCILQDTNGISLDTEAKDIVRACNRRQITTVVQRGRNERKTEVYFLIR